MNNCKVVKIDKVKDQIIFDNGAYLTYEHIPDCCEQHYLDFKYLSFEDFKGLVFDLSNDNFFKRIEGFGIALLPKYGYPIRIAGYGSNNGYYSENLSLILQTKEGKRIYEIDNCQVVKEDY